MGNSLFIELSILVAIATSVSIAMRLLKQPLIVGHILTGLIVGPFVFNVIQSAETFRLFSEIGISILLFTVGLNLNPKIIKDFGKVTLIAGTGQVALSAILGFLLCRALGMDTLASAYIGVALAFSSTIIVLKLLTDKGELDTLHSRISISLLLLQDVVAILLLFIIPLFSLGQQSWLDIAPMLTKGIAMITIIVVCSLYLLPRYHTFLGKSQELLFLFATAWGMGFAALFKSFGFSLESGALIAGVMLSTLPLKHEIAARLSPLRDFFIILFFITLGSQMDLAGLPSILPAAILLSILVMLGKPLILLVLLRTLDYKKRTSFITGISMAQISEFSLILIALGFGYGHLGASTVTLVTLIALITILCSSYFISYAEKIYAFFSPYLGVFEAKSSHEIEIAKKDYPIILLGCNRIGYDFVDIFKKQKKRFLVVDYNPEIIQQLSKDNVDAEYGDITDISFLESLNFGSVELVVSTVPDLDANIFICQMARKQNPDALVITLAHRISDAMASYEAGVDYVILPHFLGGKYAAEIWAKFKKNREKYSTLREEHLVYLRSRISAGHDRQ